MKLGEFKKSAQRAARLAKARENGARKRKILSAQAEQLKHERQAERAVGNDLYYEIPEELKITEDYVDTVSHNRDFNDIYSEYYERLYTETNLNKYRTLGERVHNCNKFWFGDHYRLQRVFDVKNVQLCHDKFCVNCQHLKQASRLMRFTPVFDELRNTYDLYHLTLTVPNVGGTVLEKTVGSMFNAFKKLIRYFSGDAKIKGVDFAQYGYGGAVRCLEIVTNPTDFHPHIHSAILLKKDLPLYKEFVNCYSFNHGKLERIFSELEILIQKIWFLALNNTKVNLENISTMPDGYSCTLNEVEDDGWHEVFKYVTKLTKDGAAFLTYEQFKVLYSVLYRCKVMQGYGLLYRVAENDEVDASVEEAYAEVLARLRLFEKPEVNTSVELEKLMHDLKNKNITFISKRLFRAWLEECREIDKLEHPF
ncbi:MAG: protein rep [Clostridiales bacterium]|nr:protein rep [Clostridiales bacterium]